MLVEFSAKNYRSIRTHQTLSLAAGSSKSVRARYSVATGVRAVPWVLRAAGIFGPNGSGKTSILLAMSLLREMVINSAREGQAGDEIDVHPFKLDEETRHAPSDFEIVFITNGTLYQYGFSATRQLIVSEWLFATPSNGRIQKLIDRKFNQDTNSYDTYINPSVKGERRIWIESTRPNSLLLSTAIQLNSDAFSPIYDWISRYFRVIMTSGTSFGRNFTAHLCLTEDKRRVLNILRGAGIDVFDIKIREVDLSTTIAPLPDELKAYFAQTFKDAKTMEVTFVYKDSNGDDVDIAMEDESDGTQMLFSLAGPLIDVSQNGYVMVVDEIHRSLHPMAFRYIIDQFFQSNPKSLSGQIVFTSHETYVMQNDSMHRDEIWLVEKRHCAGTHLTPLSDFKARAGETHRNSYLGGRYGAVPPIGLLTDLP